MRFNQLLPVRFYVLRRAGARAYELQTAGGVRFSLASRLPLRAGAHYLAEPERNGVFSHPREALAPAALAAPLAELLQMARAGGWGAQLLAALLGAQNRGDYELLKTMILALLARRLEVAGVHEGAAVKVVCELSPGGSPGSSPGTLAAAGVPASRAPAPSAPSATASCDHPLLGLCELGPRGFAAEFSCVRRLFEKL